MDCQICQKDRKIDIRDNVKMAIVGQKRKRKYER